MTHRVYEGDQRLTGNIHTQMWLLKKKIAGKITCYMALSKPHIMSTVIIKVRLGILVRILLVLFICHNISI